MDYKEWEQQLQEKRAMSDLVKIALRLPYMKHSFE